ncbi:hypothetical protein BDM02DRAFT_3182830 [Thelephora ganbajun]|uniref:Uncharacterized protein n=1 Tax=Thelephora ganbajun TaxID=370292 RepID=A0ACB6ZU09_THEGA|nr:hypothetical protein BDM02DRAFT_3182830 [Thelephora ganbajun]
MSSRKAYIRKNFIAAMRKQEVPAICSTNVATRRIEPFSESVPVPSHPAFDRLEEMKMKQLQEDCETLKKGFIKLRDKYIQSTARISAAEDELNTCRGESEQLRTQVTTLREELRVQNEALAERVTSATSAATVALRAEVHHARNPLYTVLVASTSSKD